MDAGHSGRKFRGFFKEMSRAVKPDLDRFAAWISSAVRRAPGLRERTIGTARTGRGRYDLPLSGASGTGFLMLLVALMTFLAMLALSGAFALQEIGTHWRSGLEGRATVEIPATDSAGKILSESTRSSARKEILSFLKGAPAVMEAKALERSEIAELVGPWLGDTENLPAMEGIALPDLIAVTLARDDPESIAALDRKIRAIAPRARIDAHQDWLGDMLRFTGALQTAALILALVTGATTAASVGGAVRSRMAEHKADIEILHLMGATDSYVIRQFQRHSMSLAFRGGCAGLAGGWAVMLLISFVAGSSASVILPDVSFSGVQIAVLLALPLFAAGIACLAARLTVRRALAHMP